MKFPHCVQIDFSTFIQYFQVRKYLIPDSNDEIRQEQMREMELLNTTSPINDKEQDDMGSDDTGSNSSAAGSNASPSPPSSTVIAMRGINGQRIGKSRRNHVNNNETNQQGT